MSLPNRHERAEARQRAYPLTSRAADPYRARWCAGFSACLRLAARGQWRGMECPRVCPGYTRMTDEEIDDEYAALLRVGESLIEAHLPTRGSGVRGGS